MAKRKFLVFTTVLFLLAGIANAEVKEYYNKNDNYSGIATATYQGTTKSLDPKKCADSAEQRIRSMGAKVSNVQKLSKPEAWLIWQALGEYNYTDGEIYRVTVTYNHRLLCLVAVITNGGKSFLWYGGIYAE